MADDEAQSEKTLSTIIDELDNCIAEHFGLPGTFEVETDSVQSSILSLRAQLVEQRSIHGDLLVDQVMLTYDTAIPLPGTLRTYKSHWLVCGTLSGPGSYPCHPQPRPEDYFITNRCHTDGIQQSSFSEW